MKRVLRHAHRNTIAYAGLLLAAVGATGGYALGASGQHTIKACADRGTGILHLQARCRRDQRAVSWNQQGPAGSAAAWAHVYEPGVENGSHGISVQHTGTGTYRMTITASQCLNAPEKAPVVTVSDNNVPSGPRLPGEFPTAWALAATGANTFTVDTGYVNNGQFTPFDENFVVQVECG
jgi:hypothetical protein